MAKYRQNKSECKQKKQNLIKRKTVRVVHAQLVETELESWAANSGLQCLDMLKLNCTRLHRGGIDAITYKLQFCCE